MPRRTDSFPLTASRRKQATSNLDGVEPGFPCSYPDRFFDVRDEDFAVADSPCLSGAPDRLDGFFNHVATEHNLDFHFGQKIDHIFGPAVEFGVALLAAEPLCFGDRNSLQTDFLQCLLNLIELEWLDDRLNFFHRVPSPGSRTCRLRPGTDFWIAGPVPLPLARKVEAGSVVYGANHLSQGNHRNNLSRKTRQAA